jgi:hypothetical protein
MIERHPRAQLVVGRRNAPWHPFVHDGDLGAPIHVRERRRHRHLAGQVRVRRLELEHLDDLLVRHQPREVPVVGIGVRRGLAGRVRRVVRQRHAELPAFPGVEFVHVTGHAVRHPPLRDRVRVEEGSVDICAGCVDAPRDPGRSHAQNSTSPA